MNEKKGLLFYEVMALVAYGYFILIALASLLMIFYLQGNINFVATAVILVFGIQAKIRHKLANLIIGVLTFAVSIFFSLECLSRVHSVGLNLFTGTMTSIALGGIFFSLMLILSYTKISFKDI